MGNNGHIQNFPYAIENKNQMIVPASAFNIFKYL